jgi:hypothetical protein
MGLFGEMGTDAAEDRQAAGVGHAVAGDASFAFGSHQAMGAEAHQVLTNRRLRAAEARGELRDLERALLEGFDDAEAIRVGKGAEGPGALAEDLGIKRLGFRHIQKFECIWAGGKREEKVIAAGG